MLENFVKVADMPQEVIEKYKDQVPAELLQIWQEDDLGTILNGGIASLPEGLRSFGK